MGWTRADGSSTLHLSLLLPPSTLSLLVHFPLSPPSLAFHPVHPHAHLPRPLTAFFPFSLSPPCQDEIGRKPEGEGSMEREGYSLGAGLALGLVTLGTLLSWGDLGMRCICCFNSRIVSQTLAGFYACLNHLAHIYSCLLTFAHLFGFLRPRTCALAPAPSHLRPRTCALQHASNTHGWTHTGTAGRAWGLWDLRMEDRLQRYFSPALDPSVCPSSSLPSAPRCSLPLLIRLLTPFVCISSSPFEAPQKSPHSLRASKVSSLPSSTSLLHLSHSFPAGLAFILSSSTLPHHLLAPFSLIPWSPFLATAAGAAGSSRAGGVELGGRGGSRGQAGRHGAVAGCQCQQQRPCGGGAPGPALNALRPRVCAPRLHPPARARPLPHPLGQVRSSSGTGALILWDRCAHPLGQALRHFWVLAVEERAFVEAVDVDTWQPVIAPLHLTLKPSDSSTPTALSLHTPCLLPPLPQLRELRLCGRNFWPLRVAARIAGLCPCGVHGACMWCGRQHGGMHLACMWRAWGVHVRHARSMRRGGHGAVAAVGGGGRKAVGSAMGVGVGGEGSGGQHLVLLVKGRGAQAGSGGGAAAVDEMGDPRSRMGEELPPVSARSMAAALPVADPVLSAFNRLFCCPLPRSAVQPHGTSSHEGFSSACQAALLMAHAAEQPELLEVLLSLATTCHAVRSLPHAHATCGSALPCLVSSFQVVEAFIPSLSTLSSPTLSHRASSPQSPIVSPLFLRSLCSTLHRHLLAPAHRTRSLSTSPLLRQHLEDYSRWALLLWRPQEQQASDLAGAAAAEASGSMSRPLAHTTQEQPGSQLFPLFLLAFAFPSPLSLGHALHTAMTSCSPPASAASTPAPLSPPFPLPLLLALLLPHLRQHSAVMAMLLEVVQNLR
ncbi:unnamed protein product [Closterium sp. NIES-54]